MDVNTSLPLVAGYFDSEVGHTLLALSYIMDLLLVMDVILQLRTAVDTPHGEYIEHHLEVTLYIQ